MCTHYGITLAQDDTGLWRAHRHVTITTHGVWPALDSTGTTLRDALDEMALQLERERQEHDNAPH